MSGNESDSNEAFDTVEISLPRSIRFWLLFLTDVPSIICSFVLLIYLIVNRTARHDPIVGIWEFVGNNILPGLLVAFVSIALLIRVIRQKQRLNQQIHWRKHRKMTMQLLSISTLNIIFILPLNLLSLAHLCGLPDEYSAQIQQYFYFAGYFFIFLIPFVSLASIPELCKKIKLRFSRHRQVAAGDINLLKMRTTRK